MKWFGLIMKNLLRNKRRTVLTMMSMAFALFIYTVLQTGINALGVKTSTNQNETRLAVMEKYSGVTSAAMLPESYWNELENFDHVVSVAPLTVVISTVKVEEGLYLSFAIDPQTYRQAFATAMDNVPNDQYENFTKTKNGVLVGSEIMKKYKWRVGDNITLESLLVSTMMPVTICGVMHNKNGADAQINNRFLLQRDYYEELIGKPGLVNLYALRINDPHSTLRVIQEIDNFYSEGPVEVRVETEGAMQVQIAAFTQTIRMVLRIISVLVLTTIMVVSSNTIAISTRERRKEIGVLKTVGYTNTGILLLICGEAVAISIIAGMAGTIVAYSIFAVSNLSISVGTTVAFVVTPATIGTGFAISLTIGVLSGLIPAYNASRVEIVEAMRSV